MNWLKPSIEATETRYIVAILDVEYENETCEEMHILSFDGIKNRWNIKNIGGFSTIALSDLKYYIPLPRHPNDLMCLVKELPLKDSSKD